MAVALLLFVVQQAVATLTILTSVERERDGWQRPQEILQQLDAHPGNVVVDLGSGAGYFTLKLAPMVGPDGPGTGRRSSPGVAGVPVDPREARVVLEHPDHSRRGRRPGLAGRCGRCGAHRQHVPRARAAGTNPARPSRVDASWRAARCRRSRARGLRPIPRGSSGTSRDFGERRRERYHTPGFRGDHEGGAIHRSLSRRRGMVARRLSETYFLNGCSESSARFSSRTLTRGSPKNPS